MLVNRAPVMTLWAAVVAEQLGFDRADALSLGRAVAGLNAQSKGRKLGVFKPNQEEAESARQRKPDERLLVEACQNAEYKARMRAALGRARAAGVTHVAFGDLFLADIRAYRERLLAGTNVEPVFPAWCAPADTPALAREMLAAGVGAVVACVDPIRLDRAFAGRAFDAALLADLPPGVDPCGENGEFHTVFTDGPAFTRPVAVRAGEVTERGGYWHADVLPAGGDALPGVPAPETTRSAPTQGGPHPVA